MFRRARILYRYIRHGEIKNGLDAFWGKESSCQKECIICGDKVNNFYPHGVNDDFFSRHSIIGGGKRKHSLCLHCNSIDRERWQYYVISRHTDLLKGSCTVLHIAPEKWLMNIIKANNDCIYFGGDIRPGVADHVVDLTHMPEFENNFFDYVIVNHVMEHIPKEKAAFDEIKRVLKKEGQLILSFPICKDMQTFEDESVDTDEKRLFYYGQENHVRLYGSDYQNHVSSFGFRVRVFSPSDELSAEEIEKYGLISDDVIMLCSTED